MNKSCQGKTSSNSLLKGTTSKQPHCLTSVLQLGSVQPFVLKKQCVYVIFGPDPRGPAFWLGCPSQTFCGQDREPAKRAQGDESFSRNIFGLLGGLNQVFKQQFAKYASLQTPCNKSHIVILFLIFFSSCVKAA